MTTMNGEGWPGAAFAETLPVVYTIVDARARRAALDLGLRARLVGLVRRCQEHLAWLRRACGDGDRPPP
jgi:hypothetical protein